MEVAKYERIKLVESVDWILGIVVDNGMVEEEDEEHVERVWDWIKQQKGV